MNIVHAGLDDGVDQLVGVVHANGALPGFFGRDPVS